MTPDPFAPNPLAAFYPNSDVGHDRPPPLAILEVGYPVTRDEWAQVISGDLFTITCARHGRAPDCPRLVQSRHQWDIDPHAPAHVSCLPLGNDRRRDVIPGRD